MTKPFFWLHIRKAGGTSLRSVLGDQYIRTNRSVPTPFVALPKAEWNDNLNNHRIPLGAYEFKRMLFAKMFLYDQNEFANMYKFAMVRNPYERAVSCWRYLTKRWIVARPRYVLAHYKFEKFLEIIPELWQSDSHRHLLTHAAPIWPDLTDEKGVLLVDQVLRLETIDEDLLKLCETLGIPYTKVRRENSTNTSDYRKYFTKKAVALIDDLYKEDIENLRYSPY